MLHVLIISEQLISYLTFAWLVYVPKLGFSTCIWPVCKGAVLVWCVEFQDPSAHMFFDNLHLIKSLQCTYVKTSPKEIEKSIHATVFEWCLTFRLVFSGTRGCLPCSNVNDTSSPGGCRTRSVAQPGHHQQPTLRSCTCEMFRSSRDQCLDGRWPQTDHRRRTEGPGELERFMVCRSDFERHEWIGWIEGQGKYTMDICTGSPRLLSSSLCELLVFLVVRMQMHLLPLLEFLFGPFVRRQSLETFFFQRSFSHFWLQTGKPLFQRQRMSSLSGWGGCNISSCGIGILTDAPLNTLSNPLISDCRIGPAWQALHPGDRD